MAALHGSKMALLHNFKMSLLDEVKMTPLDEFRGLLATRGLAASDQDAPVRGQANRRGSRSAGRPSRKAAKHRGPWPRSLGRGAMP